MGILFLFVAPLFIGVLSIAVPPPLNLDKLSRFIYVATQSCMTVTIAGAARSDREKISVAETLLGTSINDSILIGVPLLIVVLLFFLNRIIVNTSNYQVTMRVVADLDARLHEASGSNNSSNRTRSMNSIRDQIRRQMHHVKGARIASCITACGCYLTMSLGILAVSPSA
jgi:hypothetical protein